MSDKKNKDNRKEDTKSKKNMKKTQEMPVSTELKAFPHSCTDCGVLNCSKRNASYPEFCLTEKLTEKELEKVVKLYTENEENNKIAIASAEVEGGFYGKYTRVEEIMEVAKRIGAKKIGIATCVGHDSLFYKYSKALATTLVTKDRVLAHNPVGALYQTRAYYKRLLQQPLWDDEGGKKEEK